MKKAPSCRRPEPRIVANDAALCRQIISVGRISVESPLKSVRIDVYIRCCGCSIGEEESFLACAQRVIAAADMKSCAAAHQLYNTVHSVIPCPRIMYAATGSAMASDCVKIFTTYSQTKGNLHSLASPKLPLSLLHHSSFSLSLIIALNARQLLHTCFNNLSLGTPIVTTRPPTSLFINATLFTVKRIITYTDVSFFY